MADRIELILTDLDGTLVDTKTANYHTYKEVLAELGIVLSEQHYNKCFGLRLEEFLQTLEVTDVALLSEIRQQKSLIYPKHFDKIVINRPLLVFLEAAKRMETLLAVVSTARRENIGNVLRHIGAEQLFNLIVAGEDVTKSKPDPECYVYAMRYFGMKPASTLVFEDTPIGIQAAFEAGANYFAIGDAFYEI